MKRLATIIYTDRFVCLNSQFKGYKNIRLHALNENSNFDLDFKYDS